MTQICEIDDTATQLDQGLLFGGFHKRLLNPLSEENK